MLLFGGLSFIDYFLYFSSLVNETVGMIGTKMDGDDEDISMAAL